jgi:hypothetical protein
MDKRSAWYCAWKLQKSRVDKIAMKAGTRRLEHHRTESGVPPAEQAIHSWQGEVNDA